MKKRPCESRAVSYVTLSGDHDGWATAAHAVMMVVPVIVAAMTPFSTTIPSTMMMVRAVMTMDAIAGTNHNGLRRRRHGHENGSRCRDHQSDLFHNTSFRFYR